jgi:hypothetical protein
MRQYIEDSVIVIDWLKNNEGQRHVSEIARGTGLSRARVSRARTHLIDIGHISRSTPRGYIEYQEPQQELDELLVKVLERTIELFNNDRPLWKITIVDRPWIANKCICCGSVFHMGDTALVSSIPSGRGYDYQRVCLRCQGYKMLIGAGLVAGDY